MQRSVAVVGGGVGGLTAAVGLARDGWHVVVLERASGPATDGTALGMWPDAVRALDGLGLGPELRARSTRETGGTFRRPDGTVLATMDVDRITRGGGVRLIARPDLAALLAGALPDGALRYGAPVEDVPALLAEHDLVVGADGVRSAARAHLLGTGREARLRPTGTVAFRGVARVRVDAGSETWGRAARFGVLPHGAGRDLANWYATLPTADVRAADGDDVALLRERFGAWHDPIGRVLDRIDADGHLRHELVDLHPHLRRYTDGRSLALLGDAAHAMTPDLGQGACQALLDGVALAGALRGRPVSDGLAAYDRARRRPTQRLVTLARTVHRLASARRGVSLRDAVIRVAPV